VVVEQRGARREFVARRGVVLATGGFEWNAELRARHFPGPFDRIGSPRSNEGDGQRLALAAGAALARMDQANIYPTLPTFYGGTPPGRPPPLPGGARRRRPPPRGAPLRRGYRQHPGRAPRPPRPRARPPAPPPRLGHRRPPLPRALAALPLVCAQRAGLDPQG